MTYFPFTRALVRAAISGSDLNAKRVSGEGQKTINQSNLEFEPRIPKALSLEMSQDMENKGLGHD